MTSIQTTFYQKIKKTTILSNSTIFHNRINSSHTWILFFRWILQPGYYFSGKLDYRTLFFSKFRLVPQIGHYSTVTNFNIACSCKTTFNFQVLSWSLLTIYNVLLLERLTASPRGHKSILLIWAISLIVDAIQSRYPDGAIVNFQMCVLLYLERIRIIFAEFYFLLHLTGLFWSFIHLTRLSTKSCTVMPSVKYRVTQYTF